MPHLFVGHLVEHLGGGGKRFAQALGKAAIDAAVLVLVGDGESQDFLLGKIGEAFHNGLMDQSGLALSYIRLILNKEGLAE